MLYRRIFVGISGGIDSTASVIMLQEQGYIVTGVYLLMNSETADDETKSTLNDISNRLGIEIIIHNTHTIFRERVVEEYKRGISRGNMLSPCVICNYQVKWRALYDLAMSYGVEHIAMGHYCRITTHNNLSFITRGIDDTKEQSYYLWRLPQEIVRTIIFPLGEMTKREVRAMMETRGWLSMTNKPESMGLCFFQGLRFRAWLEREGVELKEGEIIDSEGNIVGTHNGYQLYTLAQRRGFTITDEKARGSSVISIDSNNNRLTIGDSSTLLSREIFLRDYYFHDIEEALTSHELVVKVRGIGVNPRGYCKVEPAGELLRVSLLDDSAWAVTKGQSTIFYIGDRVVGGGIVF